ncbi:hypothetical protein KJ652_05180 [Patescibacteria group bacterium]|nr:hypothetical protein [Patescibacteria group bacterium]MBU1123956.1 hypothetical protein [Patescibacteria group bacterium]MBU1910841.1 hypothetical protein [Patescibacteria group bacterium]
MPSKPKTIEQKLIASIDHLNDSVQRLTKKSTAVAEAGRSVGIYFFRGIMYGLGILFAIAIVIPLTIWALQWVEWVPLIGDFLADIAARMGEVSRF